MQTKFIFVTGGVMSGLGKGVTTSSIAKLLQLSDQKVSCIKIDPYLNYDAGTMNPIAMEKSLLQKMVVNVIWILEIMRDFKSKDHLKGS